MEQAATGQEKPFWVILSPLEHFSSVGMTPQPKPRQRLHD